MVQHDLNVFLSLGFLLLCTVEEEYILIEVWQKVEILEEIYFQLVVQMNLNKEWNKLILFF